MMSLDERKRPSKGFKHNSVKEMFEALGELDDTLKPHFCKPRKLTVAERKRKKQIDEWCIGQIRLLEEAHRLSRNSTLVFTARKELRCR